MLVRILDAGFGGALHDEVTGLRYLLERGGGYFLPQALAQGKGQLRIVLAHPPREC